MSSHLRPIPITLVAAKAFVDTEHRHHEPPQGHKFSSGVVDDEGQLRGVMVMGRPVARMIDQHAILEVTRVATDGCPNACSALYGQACRIGVAHGYEKVQTYTLVTEPGTSLRAAGWKPVATTTGGTHDRPSRRRQDSSPTCAKVRWECRHSDLDAIDLDRFRLVDSPSSWGVASGEATQSLGPVGV